jgi:UDP-glucose 4-epimerase
MRILITGVAGFLGSHLATRMLSLGHTVVGVDNMLGGYPDNVPQGVEFFPFDCCDFDDMVKATAGVDIAYHAAATAHEGLSVFSPSFITTNIFQASVSVVSAAIRNRVTRFVYCSSMARYGNGTIPYVETQLAAPVDPYGIAKVAGENVLRCLADLHGMEWVIAVPHNIIGQGQNYEDPYRNVVSIMVNRVLQGKPPIVYGTGEQKRCFSHIDDCLFCLEQLAFRSDVVNQIINIGPDEEFVTINELTSVILQETKSSLSPEYYPARPKEIEFASCSADKARALLGYETTKTLRDGVRDVVAYIVARGVKPFRYEYPLEIVNDLTPKTWSERRM